VNVSEYQVMEDELLSGSLILDMILDVHYRDLKSFPFYLSQVDTGAMVMKMMMDYLMWNKTVDPSGPPSVYSEQTLYNTYGGGNSFNGSELCSGLNSEIDDHGHGWIYGYFFAPTARTLAEDALRDIVIWLDYNISAYNDYRDIPVPKQGHPWHVPVAVPTGGNYNSWMAVRGIHTNRTTWNGDDIISGPITVYGFWVNDPKNGGLDENTYVTAEYFTSTYYLPLDVPGDTYNGKYLALTDPPRDMSDVPAASDLQVQVGQITGFTPSQMIQIKAAQRNAALQNKATNIIIGKALDFVNNVVRYDPAYASLYTGLIATSKPIRTDSSFILNLGNENINIVVQLDYDGVGQQFSVTLK
jgi:hypothetical protein